jgi:hypothetical protein
MVLLPVVSRLTARLSQSRKLANLAEPGMMEA